MKNFGIVTCRRSALADFFAQNQLFTFQLINLGFVSRNHRWVVCRNDTVKELANLLIDRSDFDSCHGAGIFAKLDAPAPNVAECFSSQIVKLSRRRERQNQFLESMFQLPTGDGFAVTLTVLLTTHIIGVATAFALRPCRGHGMAAISAADMPTHGEVCIDVFPSSRTATDFQAFLNCLESFKADNAFMLTLTERYVPVGQLEIASVEWLGQDLIDPFKVHGFALFVGQQGMRLDEAQHFTGRQKSFRGKARQGFLNDAGHWFITHHELAATGLPFVAVAPRGLEHPKAVQGASAHSVFGLFAIFLALMLGNAGQQVFNQLAVRVVTKFHRGGFQRCTGSEDCSFQLKVSLNATRNAADVVNDDDNLVRPIFADAGQHGLDARTVHRRSGHIVLEDINDGVAAMRRVFAAAGFL